MPNERIGVIVLVIGNHAAPLYNPITYNVYERLLGHGRDAVDATAARHSPEEQGSGEQAREQGRRRPRGRHQAFAPARRITSASTTIRPTASLKIGTKDNGLAFDVSQDQDATDPFPLRPLRHADDEQDGKWSVNFATNPQGEIDKATMSLDEAEVAFTRQASAELSSLATLSQYAGDYTTPTGGKFKVAVEHGILGLVFAGQPFQELIPWKPRMFRVKEFADVTFEFVVEGGAVKALKQKDPSGEFTFPKQ